MWNSVKKKAVGPRIILIALFLVGIFAGLLYGEDVEYTFLWEDNHPNDNVTQYRIYWRTSEGSYNETNRRELLADDLRPQVPQWPATLEATIIVPVADPNERMFFVCTAVDEDGFESDHSNEVPPLLAFSSLEAGFVISGANYSAYVIEGEGEPGDTVELYVNGVLLDTVTVAGDGTWSIAADFSAVDEGPVVITATSANAGITTDPIAGTYDKTPPAFSVTPTTGGLTHETAVIVWETNEISDSEVRFGLTGGLTWESYPDSEISADMETEHQITISGLTPATSYYYRAGSTDASGNTKVSGEINFTTTAAPDMAPPEISSIVVSSKTHNSATIKWTTNEISDSALKAGTGTGSWDTYTLPAVNAATLVTSHSLTITGLQADTQYFFRVRSTDDSNNTATSAENAFSTALEPDQDEPVIYPPAVESKTNTTATIVWTTDENADGFIDYGETTSYGRTWEDTDFVTNHSATLSGLDPETLYHYRISAFDDDGNGPAVSSDYTFTTEPDPDVDAPVITSAVSVTDRQDTRATIFWTTDELSNAQMRYGLNDVGWEQFPFEKTDTAMRTDHTLTITGLTPGTFYYFRVGATDAEGNGPTVSNSYSFNTTPDPDLDPPVITAPPVASDITSSSASISWQTDEPANSQVQYGTNGPDQDSWNTYPLLKNDGAMVSGHNISLSGLDPSKTYYLRVGSTDVAGNGPTVSAEIGFSTPAAPDDDPPVFTAPLAVTAKTNTTATLEWQTDEPANSLVQYDTQTADWDQYGFSKNDATLKTSHSIQLTGLSGNTTYHAQAGSVDAAQNGPTLSSAVTFTTAPDPDVTAPVFTAPPTVTSVTNISATITWTTDEMSNSQVRCDLQPRAWYDYTLVKENAEMVKSHSVTLTQLTPNTVYHYQAGSTDAADNGPTLSAAAAFTTKSEPDADPPQFTVPPTATDIHSGGATIEWSTSEPANSQVQYGTQENTSWGAYSAVKSDDNMVTNHRVVLTGLQAGTRFYFRAGSTDAADNGPTVSQEFDFKTDEEAVVLPPRITSPPTVTTKTNNSATIEWQTDKPGNSEVRYGRNEKTPWSAYQFVEVDNDMVTNHKVVLTDLFAETTYYYRVGSTDADGVGPNEDLEETNNPFVEESFVTESIQDMAAPVILAKPAVSAIDAHSAIVEWETDEPSNSVVVYGVNRQSWDQYSEVAQDDKMVTQHSVTLTDLDQLTTYYLRAGSFDEAGNGPLTSSNSSNPSVVVSFKTKEAVDASAPKISNVVMTWATNTTALIEWDTDEPSNSSVQYENAENPNTWATKSWSEYLFAENDAEMKSHHSVTITGLQPSTTYFFRIGSTDAKGNGPTLADDDLNPSAESSFRSADGPDKSAPQVSNTSIDKNIADRTAVVTWVTDEPGNSQVQYGTSSANWNQYDLSENDSGMVKNHRVTLTGLELEVLYYLRVSSVDASGNNHSASTQDKNPSIEHNFKLSKSSNTDGTQTTATGGGGAAGSSCFVNSLGF